MVIDCQLLNSGTGQRHNRFSNDGAGSMVHCYGLKSKKLLYLNKNLLIFDKFRSILVNMLLVFSERICELVTPVWSLPNWLTRCKKRVQQSWEAEAPLPLQPKNAMLRAK